MSVGKKLLMFETNRDRVEGILDVLRDALGPYVLRRYQAAYGSRCRATLDDAIGAAAPWMSPEAYPTEASLVADLDTSLLLTLMWRAWRVAFQDSLGYLGRSYVSELRQARNEWAHQVDFDNDHAYRIADTAVRLLKDVGAQKQAHAAEKLASELLRLRFEGEARRAREAAARELREAQEAREAAARELAEAEIAKEAVIGELRAVRLAKEAAARELREAQHIKEIAARELGEAQQAGEAAARELGEAQQAREGTARELRQAAKQVQEVAHELHSASQRLLDTAAPPLDPESTAQAGASARGRLEREEQSKPAADEPDSTPQSSEDARNQRHYVLPILQALVDLGGSAETGEILDRVYFLVMDALRPVDLEVSPKSRLPLWRSRATGAHAFLKRKGFASNEARYGTWKITEAGRRYLAEHGEEQGGA
jgi:hypothetical protein